MRSFARNRLAAAVIAAFSISTLAPLHATQLIVKDGSTQPATGTYDTRSMSGLTDPFALAAINQNSRINGNDVKAYTSGTNAHAVFANLGGKIDLTDSSIRSAGDNAHGVVADKLGTVTLTRTKIDLPGLTNSHGNGAMAVAGGSVAMDDSSVFVTNGEGLVATGAGSRIEAGSTSIRVTGGTKGYNGVSAENGGLIVLNEGSAVDVLDGIVNVGGAGLRAAGAASEIRGNDVQVTTSGGHGVVASSGGLVSLEGADVDATAGQDGASIHAVTATGAGSRVVVGTSTVRSHDTLDHDAAVAVESGARIELGDGTKVYADGTGALADGSGSTLVADGAAIEADSIGVSVENGAQATLRNGTSITGSSGVAITSGAKMVGSDSTILATGVNRNGVAVGGGSSLDLVDTDVDGQAHAVQFLSSSAQGAPNMATISGGHLFSAAGAAIFAEDDPVDAASTANRSELHVRDGVEVTGANNQLVRVVSGNQPVHLSIFTDDVALAGDMVAEPGGILDLSLSNASSLRGAIEHGNAVALDQTSRWDITRNSDAMTVHSAGTLAFAAPAAGDFKTLTVNGDYVGEGGTLAINTALAGDDSATDRLVVHGATSGDTVLAVTNAGGAGAYTSADGIQVVQVDGASQGQFALSGRVVAGANEYLLAQGGKTTPTDGDWYLRSEAPPVVEPPVVEPPVVEPPVVEPPVVEPPVVTPDEPVPVVTTPVEPEPVAPEPAPLVPVYRPEIGAYLGNQHAAVTMFNHTMHDRVGQPTFAEDSRSDDRGGAAWMRVRHDQFDATTGARQVDTATDTDLLQLGGELVSWTAGDSRFHIGGMGGWGRAMTHVGSMVTGYEAKGRVTGYNLGVYGTWFANAKSAAGLYIDGSLQGGRFSNRVEGDYLPRESYDSQSLSASIEAGYAIPLLANEKTQLFVQPQAQVIYTGYKADQHVESNGALFTSEDAGGLTTRLGARVYGNAAGAGINRVQPFLELNWWHAGEGDSITLGGQRIDWDLPQDVYETKLGAQVELGGQWNGWGNIGFQSGAGDFHTVDGQVGLMRRW